MKQRKEKQWEKLMKPKTGSLKGEEKSTNLWPSTPRKKDTGPK